MKKPEILAPAGGRAQLEAAVICGADAVYFGLPQFNARRNADNFAGENLKDTVRYCHNGGVKVYITLNTIIADEELEEMHRAVDTAAMAGADALIIQDPAVAAYAKKCWPSLGIHASTQLAVHNTAGVKALMEYGFERIVVARELSAREIRDIIDETGADIEVFVHGAHCMSVSGNCYMSAMFGGRSGNRGLCAQPCRLDWKAGGRNHVLSLKDMSYIKHLEELAAMGACSLKIEGRMKRPEYVAAAVTACRQALDGGHPDEESLRAVFSRSGFTDGYYTARRDSSMFGYRTKDDVVAAGDVLTELEQLYKNCDPRPIPVDMKLTVKEGRPSRLEVRTKGIGNLEAEKAGLACFEACAEGPSAEKALKLALSPRQAEKSLAKTGSTAYSLNSLECSIDEGLMLPASALNALRRQALEELEEKRHRLYERKAEPGRNCQDKNAGKAPDKYPEKYSEKSRNSGYRKEDNRSFPERPQLRLRFEKAEQLPEQDFSKEEFLKDGDIIILPVSQILSSKGAALAEKYKGRLWAEMPVLLYGQDGREESWAESFESLRKLGIKDICCSNIGALYIARKGGFLVHTGPEFNVLNSDAMEELKALGAEDICLSWEMSFARMRKLKSPVARGFVSYGYIPLMKLRSCPGRTKDGCGKCSGRQVLRDRTGADFTLICRNKKYSEILNSVPIYTEDKPSPPADFHMLYFTTESSQECLDIYRRCREGQSIYSRRTMGLYQRELL